MPTTYSTGKLVALGVAIAIALLALLPGAWGAALAQTAGTPTATLPPESTATTVPAGASATVQVPAADITIELPAGAVPEDVTVQFIPVVLDEEAPSSNVAAFAELGIPPPPVVSGGIAVVAQVFALNALADDGTEVVFDEPVTITVELTPETLAAAGGDGTNITLQFYNTSTGVWTPVPCTASGTTLSCEVMHFSVWALVIQTAATPTATAPGATATSGTGGVPAPADTGDGVFEESSSSRVAMMALALVALVTVAGLGARLAVRRS